MIRSRWVVLAAGALLAAGLVLRHVPEGSSGAGSEGEASVGVLAPWTGTLLEGWEEVARIEPGALGSGRIHGVDLRGDTVFLIQRNGWLKLAEGQAPTGFGSGVRGDPAWIGGGIGIAALPGMVAVLDRGRSEVSYWSREGERLHARSFADPAVAVVEPHAIAAGGDGTLFLALRTLHVTGEGEWLVVRFRAEGGAADTLYRAPTHFEPWGALNAPALAVREGGGLEIAPGNEWRFFSHDREGRRVSERVRPDGPRWAVPDSVRRGYARLLDQIPEPMRKGLLLPEHFPPVQSIGFLRDGRIAVLVAAGWEDELHIELLGADGFPVGRLLERPTADQILLAGGAILRIRELPDETVLERAMLGARR